MGVIPHAGGRAASSHRVVAIAAAVTMIAFAANSLLTRLAFQTTRIDAATFSSVRLASAAAMLAAIAWLTRQRLIRTRGSAFAAVLLAVYTIAFSYAYRGMDTGAGALILFAAAQLLMVGYGYFRGERTSVLGTTLALVGLLVFVFPSSSTAPALGASSLMAIAGLAWGGFSLVGKSDESAVAHTASSFVWAIPAGLLFLVLHPGHLVPDPSGIVYASIAGAITSGLGYVLWYWVRTRIKAMTAGTLQLIVPVLSALMGAAVLGERVSLHGALAGLMVLAGVAISTLGRAKA